MAIVEKFKKYVTPETRKQLLRYLITGGLAAVTEWALFYVLNSLAGLSILLANSAAFTSGFVISFILNRVWSFESKGHLGRQLLLYSILFGINLGLSNVLVLLFTKQFKIAKMISKAIAMGIIVLWNFVIYKKIIYK